MKFHEYAQGLYPYISGGTAEPVYITDLVGNFIQDAAMDACAILKRKEDTRYRYFKGTRNLLSKQVQYLYDHRDMDKFSDWVEDCMDESDSFEAVADWLDENGVPNDKQHIGRACAELFESVILDIINGDSASTDDVVPLAAAYDFALIDDINKKIESLPRPKLVPVPKEATPDEKTYIDELYRAYGDAEGIDGFSADDLEKHPVYAEDLDERRIDFYAAVTIQRGVLELGDGGLANQFDILKAETLDGVKDTARRKQENGYECMLAVMEQAAALPVTNYLLSKSPYWISGKIKKGVCHHLVNDKKLKWMR